MSLFQRSGLGVALDKALNPNAERKDQLAAERDRGIKNMV
jgi:hypothetical protein